MNLRIVYGFFAALALSASILFAGCPRQKQDPLSPRHIILIGIDTLRADHLSCYGYPITTSPAIDEFARGATLFEQSISHSPWTLPSFASMFTGMYPHEHRAGMPCPRRRNMDFPVTILDETHPTLAEILREQGYKTAAYTEGAVMSPHFGMARGFDVFEVCSIPKKLVGTPKGEHIFHKDVKNVVDNSLKWIRKNRGNNFFIFLHTYQPHRPLGDPLGLLEEMRAEYQKHSFFKILRQYFKSNPYPDTADLPAEAVFDWLCNERMLYDCEIRYTDYHIGRFFNQLKKWGIFDDSLIIFTSDHGSEFGEHGNIYHGNALFQESIHVPMILKLPNQQKGTRIREGIAQGVDILPTILEACGIIRNDLTVSGTSLISLQPADSARSYLFNPETNLAAGIRNHRKMIYNYNNPDQSMFFDLELDPGEKTNIFHEQPETSVSDFIAPAVLPTAMGIPCFDDQDDTGIMNQLRSLGYIE